MGKGERRREISPDERETEPDETNSRRAPFWRFRRRRALQRESNESDRHEYEPPWLETVSPGDPEARRIADQLEARLPELDLPDGLRACLMLCSLDPDRYERAVVTWLGHLCLERRSTTLSELRRALSAFESAPVDLKRALDELQTIQIGHR